MKRKNKFFILIFMIMLSFFITLNPYRLLAKVDIDSSYVLDDLMDDTTFDINDYPLNPSVDDQNSIQLITLIEYDYQALYLYIYNANGHTLPNGNNRIRISMSTHEDLTLHKKYYLDIISYSIDYRFYKFKVNYNGFDNRISKRIYDISEIEIDFDSTGFANGVCNELGYRYTYTGFLEDDTLSYSVKEIEVLHIDYDSSDFKFPYKYGDCEETDIFYITFPIKKKYGDVIGIHFAWTEKIVSRMYVKNDYDEWEIVDEKILKEDTYYDENYSSEDYQDILSYNSIEQNKFKKFLFGLFNDNNDLMVENVPFLEKIDVNTYEENQEINGYQMNKYFLSNETLNNNDFLKNDLLGYDTYILRYRFADYRSSAHFTGLIASDKKYEITDSDILDLTFLKDGKIYSLPVASKPENYIPESDIPNIPNIFESISSLFMIFEKIKNIFESVLIFFTNVFNTIKSLSKYLWILLLIIISSLIVKLISFITPIVDVLLNFISFVLKIPIKIIQFIMGFFKKTNEEKQYDFSSTNKEINKLKKNDSFYRLIDKKEKVKTHG